MDRGPGPGINLFIINTDGTNLTRLTHSDIQMADPKWSWDGKWIAFRQIGQNQKGDIALIKPDGSGQRLLTNNEKYDDQSFSWSPDSQSIAYESRRSRTHNIFSRPIVGGGERQLTNLPTLDTSPVWSADSQEILFLSSRDDGVRPKAYLMNAQGLSQQRVGDSYYGEMYASWSGDGKSVLSARYTVDRVYNIYLTDIDNGNTRALSPAKGYQSQPLIRPTSTHPLTENTDNSLVYQGEKQ